MFCPLSLLMALLLSLIFLFSDSSTTISDFQYSSGMFEIKGCTSQLDTHQTNISNSFTKKKELKQKKMIRNILLGTLAVNVDALVSEKSEKPNEIKINLRCTQMIRLINSRKILITGSIAIWIKILLHTSK